MISRALLLFVSAALVFGQLTPNSVTVTATRAGNPQPDQVVFRILVDTPLDVSRDQVISALDGAGITAANFSGVGTTQVYDMQGMQSRTLLEWVFLLPAQFSAMKSTIGLLSAVQKSNAQKNNGLTISFGVAGTQVSAQAQQQQSCALADLLADARVQAQKMATAGGANLGAVLAMQSSTQATEPTGLFAQPVYIPPCSLTVKFALSGAF